MATNTKKSVSAGTNTVKYDHPPNPFLKPVKAKILNDVFEKNQV